jgi:hypothetical protein
MGQYKLFEEIIARSVAKDWDTAVQEWGLLDVYDAEGEPETCLCGHFPIVEICVLRNRRNGRDAEVGNCCVKKFMGLPSDKIFTGLKRVRKDNDAALNIAAAEHARSKGWVNAWEYGFLIDTARKRKLTGNQLAKRQQINARVLQRVKRAAKPKPPEGG